MSRRQKALQETHELAVSRFGPDTMSRGSRSRPLNTIVKSYVSIEMSLARGGFRALRWLALPTSSIGLLCPQRLISTTGLSARLYKDQRDAFAIN